MDINNYNKRKFKYTYGDEFLLENVNYIGYYNVDIDGKQAYKSRYNTDIKLDSVRSVNSEINLSSKYFDRTIFTEIEMSYSLDDILMKPNEIINKNSINYKLDLIYNNYQDLYRYTKLADPLLPVNFNAFAAVSAVGNGVKFEWFDTSVQFISGDQTPGLETLDAFDPAFESKNISTVAIPSIKYPDSYSYFLASKNVIHVFNSTTDNTSFEFTLSANGIGSLESLLFKNIVSIASDGIRHVYVVDRERNSLFKLDANTIINKDRTGVRELKPIEMIGGTGKFDNNLNDPTYVEYGNDNVFVFSNGDNGIKKYTSTFNFAGEYRNELYFKENPFRSLTYNRNKNLLYILSDNFNVLVLDANNFDKVDEYSFKKNPFDIQIPFINFFETPRRIVFSQNNSNVYYLQTNKNVYKYFVSTGEDLIERFTIDYTFGDIPFWNTTMTTFEETPATWDQLPNFDKFYITDGGLTIVPSDEPHDRLLMLTNTKIFEFLEKDDFITLLNDINPDFYDKQSILLDGEYFNNISFNQSIYKILYNINILSANINKQLLAEFGQDTYLRFKDFNEFNYNDKLILELGDEKQFFIGVNEPVTGNALNRAFTEIYNYQIKFIDFIKTKIQNKRILSTVTVVIP